MAAHMRSLGARGIGVLLPHGGSSNRKRRGRRRRVSGVVRSRASLRITLLLRVAMGIHLPRSLALSPCRLQWRFHPLLKGWRARLFRWRMGRKSSVSSVGAGDISRPCAPSSRCVYYVRRKVMPLRTAHPGGVLSNSRLWVGPSRVRAYSALNSTRMRRRTGRGT